jgi:hypothetical protein
MLLVDENKKASLPFTDNFPVQIQISIFSNNSEYTAYVCADLGKFHCFHIGLTPQDIEELNSELQDAIEQVAASFEQNSIRGEALSRLAQKGNFAFKRVFAEGVPRETIGKALKTGATVQIAARDFAIPWELLYDGPLGAQVDASCFWGMRYIVSRALIQEARPGDLAPPIIQSARPHVGLIACSELEYVVGKEIPALKSLHERKRISLLLLRPLKVDQRYEELEYLGRFLREEEFEIIHLACHALEKKPKSQSYLLVSDNFDITIEDFGVQEFVIKHNPFVILNACLTGTISPLYTSNWAALFWGRGARGVLATELHVPDWFAAAFTEELYKHFLSGEPIGEALLATRHHFWEEDHNPLGLAYALYSSPSIRIATSN